MCTGNAEWAQDLSENIPRLRSALTLTQSVVCDKKFGKPQTQTELLKKIYELSQFTMHTKGKECLVNEMKFIMYENFCGDVENLQNLLKFLVYWLSEQVGDAHIVKLGLSLLRALQGKEGKILRVFKPWCSVPYYGSQDAFMKKKSRRHKGRKKRVFGPRDMVFSCGDIFCDRNVVVAIAQYYDRILGTFPQYDRIVPINLFSGIGCCMVEDLKVDLKQG